MDVTFTNVLEGARQYFQGLPATTAGSVFSANNENDRNNASEQQIQDRSDNNVPYWPQQQQQQQQQHQQQQQQDRSQVDVMHRAPSTHPESARPPSQQQDSRNCSSTYNLQQQSQQEQLNSQIINYNYPRPHSREVSTNNNVSQQQQQQHMQQQQHVQHYQQHQSYSQQQQQQIHQQQLQHHQIQKQQQKQQQLQHQQHMQQQMHQNQQQHYQQQPQQHLQQPQPPQQQQQQQQQVHHQQYQSHIMPNPAYHPSVSQHPRTPSRHQERSTPSSTSSGSSQTYHQLQNSTSSQQSVMQQYSHYPQSSRAHYPVHSQAQVQNHSSSSTSSYAYQSQQPYSAHAQSNSTAMYNSNVPTSQSTTGSSNGQMQNYYSNQKAANTQNYGSNSGSSSSENHHPVQYSSSATSQSVSSSQSHKTTHNLPPIAALSSTHYHTGRTGRENLRIPSSRSQHPTTSSYAPNQVNTSSTGTHHHQQQPQQQQQQHQNVPRNNSHDSSSIQYNTSQSQSNRVSNQNYHYITTIAGHSNYTTTTATNSTSSNVYHYQYSRPNSNFQSATPQTGHMYPSTKVTSHVQPPAPQVASANHGNNPTSVIKQKRESPLDLSVKTVKTSADSTLDDVVENSGVSDVQRMSKYNHNGRNAMYPHVQATYGSYTSNEVNHNNTVHMSAISKAQPANMGAPKVDFLPNFNMRGLNQPYSSSTNNKFETHKGVIPPQTPLYTNTSQKSPYERSNNTNVHKNYAPSASVPTVPVNSYPVQKISKKTSQALPRVDFPPVNHKLEMTQPYQSKRRSEMPSVVPSKIAKVDSWKQAIDQQIEQRFSSYTKLKEQERHETHIPKIDQLNNKNKYPTAGQQEHSKELYGYNYRSAYEAADNQVYSGGRQYNQTQINHNQTYVPSASVHHYPGYNNIRPQSKIQDLPHSVNPLTRTNSSTSLYHGLSSNKNTGGADKRVISLLRNSLESKGAKEAQKKLEQEQQKSMENLVNHRPKTDIQQPSTDVTAPLQPKLGLGGRQNVSPFAATSLHERNTNTPTAYKFHLPKAIDSVKFESDITKEGDSSPSRVNSISEEMQPSINNNSNSNSDYDGLAAFLAARIRTKAELKQVSTSQYSFNANSTQPILPGAMEMQESMKQNVDLQNAMCNGTGNSQKHSLDPNQYQPRKRLFSRSEDEANKTFTNNVPRRDKSGLRSSSETSVFDFPDSDSEGEMPVLERQSLNEMRRERRNSVKDRIEEGVKVEQISEPQRPDSPFDLMFDEACDKFLEELKSGTGKKRGRRKKVVEPEVIAKLEETVIKETITEVKLENEETEETKSKDFQEVVVVKQEPNTYIEIKVETESNEEVKPEIKTKETVNEDEVRIIKPTINTIKVESDSDSDVPLIDCKNKVKCSSPVIKSDVKVTVVKLNENTTASKGAKKPICDSSDSEPEPQPVKHSPKKGRGPKGSPTKQKNAEKESESKGKNIKKIARHTKKPTFGDGTEFRPGWEEEVFKYKKSLRMPSGLIHVTRPPAWHRLSTSLPDLDPCPNSPSPSMSTENADLKKTKTEIVDSDIDSNSSFNFSFNKNNNYDSEGSSSIKSMPTPKSNSSILDKLIEKYGTRKRKRPKKKEEDSGPKIIPKPEDPLELLPTPGLEITSTPESKKKEQVIKSDSVFLGFRKKTVDNFKNTFIKSSNCLIGINEQFKTVVLKSRTRKQTRVLKQKATIREVFGEERPASAPPVTCIDNTDDQEDKSKTAIKIEKDIETRSSSRCSSKSAVPLENTKEFLKGKLLNKNKPTETFDLLEQSNIKKESDSKSETLSIDDDCVSVKSNDTTSTTHSKRRIKSIRRKFSSGFDYIRKKKKQTKKETQEGDVVTPKLKKKGFLTKASPESIQDIQKEIKTWVMNKGIGETHLHRAARLGYTDITAYCLEKMDSLPSPKDNAGYTPLHEACARGHLGIARLLLMYGANVSESAQGGIRPLHEATENGFVEIVRLLLSYGADPVLATYSGLTPLSLTSDETTMFVLQNHIADIRGDPAPPWTFFGPASCFDPVPEESGFNPLDNVPDPDPPPDEEDDDDGFTEFEVSDFPLPNLYTLTNESTTDQWILLQDLSNILKIKSRDALLKQITGCSTSTASSHKNVIKELKTQDFLDQAQCSQYLCAGEKINVRASKIALVKFTDKVKKLLNIEKVVIPER